MILVKTETGQQVFKSRSLPLTPRQRSAFILFDGKRSVNEVLEAGTGIAREDIDQLVGLGLLGQIGSSTAAANADILSVPGAPPQAATAPAVAAVAAVAAAAVAPAAPAPSRSFQQRYKDAYPIATQLTGAMGLRGFRLNLSVEGTSTYEELLALVPKIRAAVDPEKMRALDRALND